MKIRYETVDLLKNKKININMNKENLLTYKISDKEYKTNFVTNQEKTTKDFFNKLVIYEKQKNNLNNLKKNTNLSKDIFFNSQENLNKNDIFLKNKENFNNFDEINLQPYHSIDQCQDEKINFRDSIFLNLKNNMKSEKIEKQRKSQSLRSHKKIEEKFMQGSLKKKIFFNKDKNIYYTKFYPNENKKFFVKKKKVKFDLKKNQPKSKNLLEDKTKIFDQKKNITSNDYKNHNFSNDPNVRENNKKIYYENVKYIIENKQQNLGNVRDFIKKDFNKNNDNFFLKNNNKNLFRKKYSNDNYNKNYFSSNTNTLSKNGNLKDNQFYYKKKNNENNGEKQIFRTFINLKKNNYEISKIKDIFKNVKKNDFMKNDFVITNRIVNNFDKGVKNGFFQESDFDLTRKNFPKQKKNFEKSKIEKNKEKIESILQNFYNKKNKENPKISIFKEKMLKILKNNEIDKLNRKKVNKKRISPDFHKIKSKLINKIKNSIINYKINFDLPLKKKISESKKIYKKKNCIFEKMIIFDKKQVLRKKKIFVNKNNSAFCSQKIKYDRISCLRYSVKRNLNRSDKNLKGFQKNYLKTKFEKRSSLNFHSKF